MPHASAPSVVHLVTRMNVGGPAAHVLSLAHHLPPEFDITVAAGRPAPVESELVDEGVPTQSVPLTRELSPLSDVRAVRAVRRLLLETRPSILHTHMAKAGAIGRAAAQTLHDRPSTVHTFHGHVLEGYFPPLRRRAFLATERHLARKTDRLIAVSEAVRDELLALGVGRPEQYEVIRPGIDVSRYGSVSESEQLRRSLGLDLRHPLLGYVGRLAPVKGVDVLLRALVGHRDVHLAIIGDGPSRQELVELADALGLRDRAHFLGWSDRVGDVLGGVDLVVCPSRHEGTPLVLMEAAAAGRPVLATRVGGVPEVVDDGVTGVLVPPDDAGALSAAIGSLLQDPEQRSELGAAGRARAAHRFDAAASAARLALTYRRLIES